MNPRPCPSTEAVVRARSLVGHGVYQLGTGDWNTPDDRPTDCAGFATNKCYQVPRHRPGFNRGNPSGVAGYDVEDDINSNSALGDAFGAQDLFVVVGRLGTTMTPQAGDLLVYPTIKLADAHGAMHEFIGHEVVVVDASGWDGTWGSLKIVQAHGPDGRTPGITDDMATHFDERDKLWPKDEHCSWLLRVVP